MMPAKDLSIKESKEYKRIDKKVKLLHLLKEFYGSGDMYSFDTGDIPMRELIAFMVEEGYPRRVPEKEQIFRKIDKEILELEETKKKMRLSEIKSRKLNSLLIIPSWTKLVGTPMKGFYLGKPVKELRRDTVVMLVDETHTFKEITQERISVIFGPGIFYSEFAIDRDNYLDSFFEINGLCLSLDLLGKIYTSEKIYSSDTINATITDVSTIIPFHVIEQPRTIQAYVKGILSRNVFHPNKVALELFNSHIQKKNSYNLSTGLKLLSAHPLWFNKFLVESENIPLTGSGKQSFTAAGVSSVLPEAGKLVPMLFSNSEEKNNELSRIKEIKKQYIEMGLGLLRNWIQS